MEILWEQNAEKTVAVACSPYGPYVNAWHGFWKNAPLAGKLLIKMVAFSFGPVGFGLLHCNACLSRCGD